MHINEIIFDTASNQKQLSEYVSNQKQLLEYVCNQIQLFRICVQSETGIIICVQSETVLRISIQSKIVIRICIPSETAYRMCVQLEIVMQIYIQSGIVIRKVTGDVAMTYWINLPIYSIFYNNIMFFCKCQVAGQVRWSKNDDFGLGQTHKDGGGFKLVISLPLLNLCDMVCM